MRSKDCFVGNFYGSLNYSDISSGSRLGLYCICTVGRRTGAFSAYIIHKFDAGRRMCGGTDMKSSHTVKLNTRSKKIS